MLLEHDPTVLEGDPLLLNCTLLHDNDTDNSVTSDDLFIQHGNDVIPETYLTRPTNITLLLNKTASLDDEGHFYCYARNYTTQYGHLTLSHQAVKVLRKYMHNPVRAFDTESHC